MTPYLSIIIPAYNEENRLPETLKLVKEFLDRQPYTGEVLVIDDGSTDGTAAAVQAISSRFPALRLVENSANKGKGGVVRQGMLLATGQYRLFMDADFSTPVDEVEKLLAYTPKYEVVIGSRHLESGSIKIKQPLKRRLISRGGNWLIQQMVLPGIHDTQCGFKLFSAGAAERIFSRQSVSGWLFDVELLTIARELGYAIKEVPVDWFDSKHSSLRATRAASQSLRDLTMIRRRARQGKYQ